MAVFRLDLAQLVALFMECIFYGIFLVTFGVCIHALWVSQLSQRSSQRYILAVAALLFFIFATSDVAFGLRHLMDAFIYFEGPGGAQAELSNISYWVNVMKALNYSAQTSIADFILIYRCFVLYNRSWLVISGLVLLWITGFVSEFFMVYVEFTLHQSTTLNSTRLKPWVTSTLAITFSLNLIATAMITFRIWKFKRNSATLHITSSDNGQGGGTLRKAIRIIIESGAMYTASVVVFFVTFLTKNNSQYAVSDCIVQIIGIAFNLIIIRISQKKVVETYWSVERTSNQVARNKRILSPRYSHRTGADASNISGTTLNEANLDDLVLKTTDDIELGITSTHSFSLIGGK